MLDVGDVSVVMTGGTLQRETASLVGIHALDLVRQLNIRRGFFGAHGISLVLPLRVQDLDAASSPEWNDFEYYREMLAFSELSMWDEFLVAFIP